MRKLSIDAKTTGGHSFYPYESYPFFKGYVDVETTTLKDIFVSNELDRINFLKMDCEGAEYEILLNTQKDGSLNNVDKIVLECHRWSCMKILNLLRNSKFYVTYDPETSTLYAEVERYSDILEGRCG